eukprot:TRINITY_DN2454_c0_g1_i2.p4 TRINITY_DN2454_c0_g1~~TRINITY_DN2454_c0_g1_i2.p4  ORF type:complete len:104 (-),score=17.36 TRINITY_DN2454_c0_g1_i2:200-511(-)
MEKSEITITITVLFTLSGKARTRNFTVPAKSTIQDLLPNIIETIAQKDSEMNISTWTFAIVKQITEDDQLQQAIIKADLKFKVGNGNEVQVHVPLEYKRYFFS